MISNFRRSALPPVSHMFAACCIMLVVATRPLNAQSSGPAVSIWHKLDTVPFRGKQDEIFMVTSSVGWYGNGEGKLYKTIDGGAHWDEQWNEPGTFIRALGFINEKVGFLGNVGTDYYPGVTDETPLYRTADGGDTWDSVTIRGPIPKGIVPLTFFDEHS